MARSMNASLLNAAVELSAAVSGAEQQRHQLLPADLDAEGIRWIRGHPAAAPAAAELQRLAADVVEPRLDLLALIRREMAVVAVLTVRVRVVFQKLARAGHDLQRIVAVVAGRLEQALRSRLLRASRCRAGGRWAATRSSRGTAAAPAFRACSASFAASITASSSACVSASGDASTGCPTKALMKLAPSASAASSPAPAAHSTMGFCVEARPGLVRWVPGRAPLPRAARGAAGWSAGTRRSACPASSLRP